MRHWKQFVVAIAATAAVGACSGRHANGTAGAEGTSGRSADLGMTERNFLKDQIRDGEKEIRLGRLAQQNGNNAAVKEFGTMMVRDHIAAGRELRDFAQRNNVDLSDIKDNPNDDNGLAKKTGPDFDKAYIDDMVKDHTKAVDDFKDRSEDKDNLQVSQFAAQMLPKMEAHLQHAQQLQQQLENAKADNTISDKTSNAVHSAKNKVKKH